MAYSVWHNSVGHTKQSPFRRNSSTLHVCCPPLGRRSHRVADSTRATAIVMVRVPNEAFPAWWRGEPHLPPATWKYTFELFTNDETADEWALAAAIFIAQYRRRNSCGPTFREVFEHLLEDTRGLPGPLPREWDQSERRRATGGFRGQVMLDWRRRGFIGFDRHVTRSLRVGPHFRERSRRLQAAKKLNRGGVGEGYAVEQSSLRAATTPSIERPKDARRGGDTKITFQEGFDATLTSDEVIARLHVTPAYLARLLKAHYLHAIDQDDGLRFPAWQFSHQSNRPVVPGIDVVSIAIPRDWPLPKINAFMLSPHAALSMDGKPQTPARWLDLGGDPVRVATLLHETQAS